MRFEDKLRRQYSYTGTNGNSFMITRAERDAIADAIEALRKIEDLPSLMDGWEGLYRAGDIARDALARLDGLVNKEEAP